MTRFSIFLAVTLAAASHAEAQRSYPMLMGVEPVAAQIGTTSEVVVKSRYTMEEAYEVLVSGEGVTGEVVLPEPDPKKNDKKAAPLQSLTLRFKVDDDAMLGVRDFRIATPTGVSTVGQLVIVRDPLVVESGDNDKMTGATEAKLPATLCGRIEKVEDVDFFKFHAEAGETICFHVRCMRLQDRIHDLQAHADPIISIRSGGGSTLAASDNSFAADPFLVHTFAESGDYFLELRDVRYSGNQYWNYCVEASSRPFVQTVFPLGIAANQKTSLRLIGQALDENTPAELLIDSPRAPGIQEALVPLGEGVQQSVSVVLADAPLVDEPSDDNDTIENASPIAVPVAVNGTIAADGDIDCFELEAKKGQRLSVEVVSRRAGASLDPHLRVLNEKGAQQQLSDDMRIGKRNYADSLIENWTVPADGKYIVEVRDVHLRGGPEFVYLLNVTHSRPHFALFTDTDKTPLTPGTSGVIFVRAEKKNGFDGEIQLAVEGLPEGVTASCGRILAGNAKDGCILLTAAADAKPVVKNIRISGLATVTDAENQSREISADATVYQETYNPGGGRGHWPVDQHAVSVDTPGDVRRVTLSTHEITLQPGGDPVTIDVEIERAEGFDKNVTLEVTYMHLNTIYGDSLPEGVQVDKSASKVLLTSGATKGTITLKAAATAKPAKRQQFAVMANVSINFVMKATYASEPVYVTVTE